MTGVPLDPSPYATERNRWNAVQRRDAAADGIFYYSVRSTGVYCRPSCAARRPRRENVAFHATCADAERAGFRPCQRCRPGGASAAERRTAAVASACRLIEEAAEAPTLETLAASAGMSRFHFHRIFRTTTGLTPRAYAAAHRARRVPTELARRATVTEALYEAGFGSNGRFYATATKLLGMTPSAFRAGGPGIIVRFAVGSCSLGRVLVAATDKGVCAILLGEEDRALTRELQARFPKATLTAGGAAFERLVATVVAFVETPQTGLALPLDIRGTAFQQRVWMALAEVPPGVTTTYAAVARRIGASGAVRAVARACAANPLAVAIPCHRVVRSDGAPSGYRWGAERKRALLDREREQRAAPAGRPARRHPDAVTRDAAAARSRRAGPSAAS
jgi:AraC family transcriptional regulator of adaptative response/methylated-DNA-[protein]-cysteine methyltransferase